MKLTIGMASYNNKYEVWSTVQALRIYHDMQDTEIVIIDNFGDPSLENWASGQSNVNYFKETEVVGTAYPRDMIFKRAKGEWVLVIDSHVLLFPGVVKRIRDWCDAHKDCKDLLHGPIVFDDLTSMAKDMHSKWGAKMWGVWNQVKVHPEEDPFEIEMHGMGLYLCRKDAWLGYTKGVSGFGGEEGVIHEKFRRVGRKVFLLPWMQWCHYFRNSGGGQEKIPYPLPIGDRIRNYYLGFIEVGLDLQPLIDNFGESEINKLRHLAPPVKFSVVYYSDLRNPESIRTYCLNNLRELVTKLGGEFISSIKTDGSPSHERLYTQILEGIEQAESDRIFLAEDDVLYPEDHFTRPPKISTFGYNKNVWHISKQGYFDNDWTGSFLSACFGNKSALQEVITKKLKEAKSGKLIHAEPEQAECIWRTRNPILDIRHGENFTGMRNSNQVVDHLPYWGNHLELCDKLQL